MLDAESIRPAKGADMLNLTTVMFYSEDPDALNAFYTKVLGEPAWENGGYVGWQAGNATLMTGPHSEVKGRNETPGRIIVNFETSDVRGEFDDRAPRKGTDRDPLIHGRQTRVSC